VEVRQTLDGRYKLLNELGSGGMAVVWRARDEVLGRPVAVKVLAGRYAGDPQSRARIRDEARAAANLSHPNIAQVYDYGEADNRPYVVMELINGPTLQQRVASAPLPPRTVFRICGEVAAGLAAAHAEGLVHRDIKMANIMVTPAGAKVVDFGIAAVAGPAAPEEMLVGTPAYLAPERLTGDVVQPASDVYALGVLLYRLLADESPWSVESTTQMLKAHVYIEPAPLPPLPGVPAAVVTLISDCLRKDPQARPTASRVSSILADAAEAFEEVRGQAAAAPERRSAGAFAGIHAAEAGAAADARESAAPSNAAATKVAPLTRPARPAPAAPADTGGRERAGRVPPDKRKSLVVAGVAAVIAAVLAAWLLIDDDAPRRPDAAAETSTSAAPAQNGGPGAPAVTSAAGAANPAATDLPGRAAIVGSGPATSVNPAGPAGTSGSVSEAPPTTSPSAPAATSETPSAAPDGKRLASPGGSVRAVCAQGKATLTNPEPADGFEVQKIVAGPALTPHIIFKGPKNRYRMTVTCVAGAPAPVVLPL
jgi:serine/threonine-protein kinase